MFFVRRSSTYNDRLLTIDRVENMESRRQKSSFANDDNEEVLIDIQTRTFPSPTRVETNRIRSRLTKWFLGRQRIGLAYRQAEIEKACPYSKKHIYFE